MKPPRIWRWNPTVCVLACLVITTAGCGPAESVHPTDELTAEQIAAIRAEDEKVALEESRGSIQRTKKPAKR